MPVANGEFAQLHRAAHAIGVPPMNSLRRYQDLSRVYPGGFMFGTMLELGAVLVYYYTYA